MKNKEYLNGKVSISKRLNNIIYILICIVVLFTVVISLGLAFYDVIEWSFMYIGSLLFRSSITMFIAYKILNKNNFK